MNNTAPKAWLKRRQAMEWKACKLTETMYSLYTTLSAVFAITVFSIRSPYLVECITFRMRGHEEASGTKYVPKELFDDWSKKDPVSNYEMYLLQQGVLNSDSVNDIREKMKQHIESELKVDEKIIVPNTAGELQDVYASYERSPKRYCWSMLKTLQVKAPATKDLLMV